MMEPEIGGTARGQVPARILDLSLGGALLAIETGLEVGAIHDFSLEVEGQGVWVQGEVRRCRPAPRGAGYEIGVEFVGIDPQDLRRLQEYLPTRRRSYPS